MQNPIPKLRLNPTLERSRKKVISDIKREIAVGLSQGDRMSTMARRISDKVDMSYRQSMLIARTEAHRVRETGLNDAANEVDDILKANYSDYRKIKIWNTLGDAAVRDTHSPMDNVVVLQDEKFELPSGATADCPGTTGIASEDCNCRCFVTHDIVTDDEFYALTGRHFKENNDNSQKQLTPSENSGIVGLGIDSATKDFDRKASLLDISDDALRTNPKFSTGGDLYENNCGNCAATYELRRRGFDVVAKPMNTISLGDYVDMFDGVKGIKIANTTAKELKADLKAKLTTLGDGARGSLFVQWKESDIGHLFSWEIKNGKLIYVDAQCGKVGAEVEKYFNRIRPEKTICMRLDNLTLTDKIKNACENNRS